MIQVAKVEIYDHTMPGPIVFHRGVPLIEGHSASDENCDYYWPKHPFNEDGKCEVIAFNFDTRRNDRFTILFRDENLVPTERVDVRIMRKTPWDTPFSIRTGVQVD